MAKSKAPIRTLGIKIIGRDRVRRRFSRLKGLRRNVRVILRSTAGEILESARDRVPVDTGLLYSTLQARETPGGAIVTAGEPNLSPPPYDEIPRIKSFVDINPAEGAPYALAVHARHPTRSDYLASAYFEHVGPLREQYLRKAMKDAVHG